MGLLARSSRGTMLTRRGGAFALVAALHVALIGALINMRMRVDKVGEPAPFHVTIAREERSIERPPEPKMERPPPPPVELVVPLVNVIIETESRAITAAPPQPVTPPAPPPVAPPVPVQAEAPVMLTVDQVDYLRVPKPSYPRAAKQARLQGIVQIWVLIDTDGHARDVRVHKSSGYAQLDNEACDAVRRALFAPYRHNGVPRTAQVIVPIEFTLTTRTASRS